MVTYNNAHLSHPTTPTRGPRTYGVTTKKPGVYCPKCRGLFLISYQERQCVTCGYVDYSYEPPTNGRRRKSLVSDGTRFVLRYMGDSPTLLETTIEVQVVRVRNKVVHKVACPFCSKTMEQASLSGKRREIREERYKCPLGHRVSLLPGRNGHAGWK